MTVRVQWDAGEGHTYTTPGVEFVFLTIGNRVFKLVPEIAVQLAREIISAAYTANPALAAMENDE